MEKMLRVYELVVLIRGRGKVEVDDWTMAMVLAGEALGNCWRERKILLDASTTQRARAAGSHNNIITPRSFTTSFAV